MKTLLAICMMATASFVWAVEDIAPALYGNAIIKSEAQTGSAACAAVEHFPRKAHLMYAKMTVTGDTHVPKASGENARTVAEIIRRGGELKDQTVIVRGRVVKYNAEIMGRNWVHLRDGTGSAVDSTNDLLVTTEDEAEIGEVVTARGVVRTDMDFGSGYTYKVLIEEATLE